MINKWFDGFERIFQNRKRGIDIPMAYTGKVLMLVENSLPWDLRVYRESETLQKAGYKVTAISIKEKGQLYSEIINGIKIYRIPAVEIFEKKPIENEGLFNKIKSFIKVFIGYIIEYFYFSFMCFVMSLYVLAREGFDVIHAHNPPDTLFFIGAFYKK